MGHPKVQQLNQPCRSKDRRYSKKARDGAPGGSTVTAEKAAQRPVFLGWPLGRNAAGRLRVGEARFATPIRKKCCDALLRWVLRRNVAGYEFASVGTFVLDAGHGADTDAPGDARVVVDGELHGVGLVLIGDFERDRFLIGSDGGDLAGNFVGLRIGLLRPMPCCGNVMRGRGSSEKQECCEGGAREKVAKRWFGKS